MRATIDDQSHLLARGMGAQQIADPAQKFSGIQVGVLKDHRFSLEPRKIENIVQDDEQRLRRTLQGRGCGTLFLVQR